MSEIADDLLHDFLTEAGEMLDDVELAMIDLERDPQNADLLNAVFRGFHTIKGGAGFLEATALVELCHIGESLLDCLRKSTLKLTRARVDVILAATAEVRVMFNTMAGHGAPAAAPPELLQRLRESLSDDPSAAEAGRAAAGVSAAPEARGTQSAGIEPLAAGSAATQVSGAALDWSALYAAVAPPGSVLPDASDAPAAAEKQAGVPGEPGAAPAGAAGSATGAAARGSGQAESLRIDVSRFDQILNLAGEIGLAKNRIVDLQRQQAQGNATVDLVKTLGTAAKQLDVLVSDLQNAVMKARMQQVGRVFQKYTRMARDLGRKLDKDLELVIEGAETELDKTLLDELNDPLVHLIRNAIDHGVDDAAARAAANKPRTAIVTLAARQEGDTVVVEIRDDGRGIDPAFLRRKAVEKGLLTQGQAGQLDDAASLDLIFLPGFSTKTEVSSVSGRGVGMDVVRTNVQRLSGRIQIESEPGHGTRISIIVPLTLAILPVLTIKLGSQLFALPLSLVREVISLKAANLQTLSGRSSLVVRGEVLSVLRLADLLGFASEAASPTGIVLSIGGRNLIMGVDGVVSRDDVVIKPLDSVKPRGISGATQAPSGALVLVLDMGELLESHGIAV
jgi:two-component system chemotaxis sensor kinase CheA